MFPAPYFSAQYFPARYWPKSGALAVEGTPSITFAMRERVAVVQCERRGTVFERIADVTVFGSTTRGAVFAMPPRGGVYFVEES